MSKGLYNQKGKTYYKTIKVSQHILNPMPHCTHAIVLPQVEKKELMMIIPSTKNFSAANRIIYQQT